MTNSIPDHGASEQNSEPHSHLRLTPGQILQGWQDNFYTPSGYLYHLFLAFAATGRPVQIGKVQVFCQQWQISEQAFYKAITHLQQRNLLPDSLQIREPQQIALRIRNRLRAELGGRLEVATPVGCIDLLTETEVIEVKSIQDWKAALAQVLAYSQFFPSHRPRIHLFGDNEFNRSEIEQTATGFGIRATFEEQL